MSNITPLLFRTVCNTHEMITKNIFRYIEVVQAPALPSLPPTCTVTQQQQQQVDKRISSIGKRGNTPTSVLRSETEDTCSSDDFFLMHLKKTNESDCK